MKNLHKDKKFKAVIFGSLAIIILAIASLTYPDVHQKSMSDNAVYGRNGKFKAGGMMPEMATSLSAPQAMMDGVGMDMYALSDAKAALLYGAPMAPGGGQTAAEADQQIIKTADLAIAVDGVENKTQEVVSIATGRGGFVQSSTVTENDDGSQNGYVTVRVPVDNFEDTLDAIKDLAVRVNRESINGQDVTEQYTDLEARLRSAKAQEEQYLEILDKATSVQDILSVQSYLQSIRYEVESLQGQLQSLGNQTEYSTISVSLEEDVRVQVPTAKFDLLRDVKLALKYVVILAQSALTFIVWLLIVGGAVIIPLGLFTGLVVWVIKKIVARL
jgi:hypothetical protein